MRSRLRAVPGLFRPGEDAESISVNLRRVAILCPLGFADCIVEGALAAARGQVALAALFVAGFAIFAVVAILSAWPRWLGARGRRLLPELLSAVLLAMSAAAAYQLALGDRMGTGFAMLVIILAAMFLIPVHRFALIAGASFAWYAALMAIVPASLLDRLGSMAFTAVATGAAIVVRGMLSRMRARERHLRMEAVAQNAILGALNDELERRNRQLGELMAIAAHDLRSPLFALRNLLDLGQRRYLGTPARLDEILGECHRSIANMLALVGGILDAHAAEELDRLPVRAGAILPCLEAALVRASPIAKDAGVALTLDIGAVPPIALFEARALDRVLDNLLSNAIRFSTAGGTVALAVEGDGAEIRIIVADEGPGIAPEDREIVFQKFRRGSRHPARRDPGSGLGLYIARRLAELMGGRLDLRDRPGGACFALALSAGPEGAHPDGGHGAPSG